MDHHTAHATYPPPAPGPAPLPDAHLAFGQPAATITTTTTATSSGRAWLLGLLAAAVAATGFGVVALSTGVGAGILPGRGGADPDLVAAADEAPSGNDVGPVDPAQTPVNDQTGEEPIPVPGTAMTVEQANASVVRIEATGEFVDPEFGPLEGVGSGSGFIIDDAGIAVTNNHVVAGAAFLEVFVPGVDGPLNARVLATSECSDLAVIDIVGDGFASVSLGMAGPTIGTEVYAAGYPLGDPEFTLTKGIVSRASTGGDTHLSSVDGVLEHDARINPGNSGGPLFNSAGQVVGVNYQGNPSTRQSFAITAANALPIIEQLQAGNSIDSIGINGQIVDLGDRYGLFVASVETGSMADRVGLVGGDVILELENVAVSTDGTMGAYCDVLRTNGTDVPLDVTVLRPSTDQLLFGTLNGDRVAVGFDAGNMMESSAPAAGHDQGQPAETATGYRLVSDDHGVVSVEVPVAWTEVATGPLGMAGDLPNVSASTDLDSYENDWVVGGLQLTAFAFDSYGFEEIWSARTALLDNCADVEAEQEVDFGSTDGRIQLGHRCGPDGVASLVLFQVSGGGERFASGIVQVVTDADVAATERALSSFSLR